MKDGTRYNYQGDSVTRRGDDRTREYGRANESQSSSYRAGDDDAHRDDRDMAYGNYGQNRDEQRNSRYQRDSRSQRWEAQRGPARFQDSHYRGSLRYPTSDYDSQRFEEQTRSDRYYGSLERPEPNRENFGYDRDFSRSNLGTDYRHTESDYESKSWNGDANTESRYGRGYYGLGQQIRPQPSTGYETSPTWKAGADDWTQGEVSHYGRGPKGYRRSDERIKEDVSEALEQDHKIDASEIEVDVKEGVVTLRGHAEDRRQKRLAEDCVASINGVKDVRNELGINQSLFQRAKEALMGAASSQNETRTAEKKSNRH